MNITASDVKKFRDMTGAGMMEAKQALTDSDGDIEKAKEWLRQRGSEIADKKAERNAVQGLVVSYIHAGGKVGVLLELNCETDFVAKNEEFKKVASELALQVAGMNPLYINSEDVPTEELDAKKAEWKSELEGKPAEVADKIIAGKMDKWLGEVCLMNQPFFRDDSKKAGELIHELVGIIKENIKVGRFVRMPLGGEMTVAQTTSTNE
jgi:elongation factor Ts